MSDTLTLNCFVLGSTMPGNSFSVDIAHTKNVHALKEVIKDKNPHMFGSIATDKFDLYHPSKAVAMLDDDDLMLALTNPPQGWCSKLGPQHRLLEIFKDAPLPCTLHILVQLPSTYKPSVTAPDLIINCLVHGNNTSQAFPIKISGTKTVGALREAVAKKMLIFDEAPEYSLTLYGVSIAWDEHIREKLEALTLNHVQQLVNPLQTLSDMDLPQNHLHIIAEPVRTWSLMV
ncbi:hypothetical protein V8B97DRAFT_1876571 [Scleroderma yunnanense]